MKDYKYLLNVVEIKKKLSDVPVKNWKRDFGLAPKTIYNALNGKPVAAKTRTDLAKGLGLSLKKITAEELPYFASSEAALPAKLQYSGFDDRNEAFRELLRWQERLQPKKARIVSFSMHTLEYICLRLLEAGLDLEIFLGTIAMAKRLNSRRQVFLLKESFRYNSDFHRFLSKVNYRFYDIPPTASAIALDDCAYLLNPCVWVPTLRWQKEDKQKKEAYEKHWQSVRFLHRTDVDHSSVNSCDMLSIMACKDEKGLGDGAFHSLASTFDLLWKSLEQDEKRLGPKGQPYKPFEEMKELERQLRATPTRRRS